MTVQEDAIAAAAKTSWPVEQNTGDIGRIDEDGFLSVVDRKKELIITSSGKNVAPSNIENLLKESPVIGHAMAFGDGRPYVVAVLTLDPEVAPVVAQRMGVQDTDLAALAELSAYDTELAQAICDLLAAATASTQPTALSLDPIWALALVTWPARVGTSMASLWLTAASAHLLRRAAAAGVDRITGPVQDCCRASLVALGSACSRSRRD